MATSGPRTHHVFLLDGTTHDLTKPRESHIAWLMSALVTDGTTDNSGSRQCVYYEPGIGSQKGRREKVDTAFAFQFVSRVSQTLGVIKDNYRDGDGITIVGYSRGGAAAMLLARFIRVLGIPSPDDSADTIKKRVKKLIRKKGRSYRGFETQKRGARFPDALVTRLILLDPVASARRVRHRVQHNNIIFETSDASQVICCYSVDESRRAFAPVKFAPRDSATDDLSLTRSELAVFHGGHGDIGGASKSRTSRIGGCIPLRYIITKAHTMEPQLVFKPEILQTIGLDLSKLSLPREPPLVNNTVNYAEAVRQRPEIAELLQNDKDASEVIKVKKPRSIMWRLPFTGHRRKFDPPVKVHWTARHHEVLRNDRIEAKLPDPREYTA